MSSRQVPPGSPFEEEHREETIPLADYGDGRGMADPPPGQRPVTPPPANAPLPPPPANTPPPPAYTGVNAPPAPAYTPPPEYTPPPAYTPANAPQPPWDTGTHAPPSPPAPRVGAAVAEIVREMRTPETKESFKTSEFMLLLLGIVGVLLASEISAEFDAPRAWMAITILSVGYLLSRGFAKAGTSRDSSRSAYAAASAALDAAASDPASRRAEAGQRVASGVAEQLATPETKVFYKSTEFMLWALAVIGILLASLANAVFDATGAWRLITYLSAAYIISRGLAKAASDRGYSDPNYGLPADVTGRPAAHKAQEADEFTRRHISTPETKEFFKTSEFLVLVLTIFGLAIASNVDLFFDATSAWTYLTIVVAAYMVSRGLAKLGTKDPHLYDA